MVPNETLFEDIVKLLRDKYKPGTTIVTDAGAQTRAEIAALDILELLMQHYAKLAAQQAEELQQP